MCFYIADKSIKADMRRKIGNLYFGGEFANFTYDPMKHHPARTEYLIFAGSAEASTFAMALVPCNSVIGEGLCAIADPDPWDIGILASAMFAEWTKSIGGTSLYATEYFPFPPKREKDSELMEPYIAPLYAMWRAGKTQKISQALKKLNDYVDSLYLERCRAELDEEMNPTCDRPKFLLALCDKRGALAKAKKEIANYNRQNILAYPGVPRKALPLFIAVLNSKEPVRPSFLDKYVIAKGYAEPFGFCATLTSKGLLRKVDTPQTVIDKNGRKLNTLYEAVPDYMDFFMSWLECYLPAECEKRWEVWKKAQFPGTEERNPLFPEWNEYKSLKILWSENVPMTKTGLKSHGGIPDTLERLVKKGLVRVSVSKSRTYEPTMSEMDFDTIAVREIISKITVDEKDTVISEIESRFNFDGES